MSGVSPVVLSSHLSLILFHTSHTFCTALLSDIPGATLFVTVMVSFSGSLPSSSSSSVCGLVCSTCFSVATPFQMVDSGSCVRLYQYASVLPIHPFSDRYPIIALLIGSVLNTSDRSLAC